MALAIMMCVAGTGNLGCSLALTRLFHNYISKTTTTTNNFLPNTVNIRLSSSTNDTTNILFSHVTKLPKPPSIVITFTKCSFTLISFITTAFFNMARLTAEDACTRDKALFECNHYINGQDLADAIFLFSECKMNPFTYLTAKNLKQIEITTAWHGRESVELRVAKWRWKVREKGWSTGDNGPITTIREVKEGEAAAESGDGATTGEKKGREKEDTKEKEKKKEKSVAGCLFCPRGGPAAGFCTVM